ncbi:DUF4352 domain-containing protein [Clostridium sp. 001]|uniref:DUF4352 domain-containing protein n=1 Tax=Clostridium sp. 001 TaxID=1970093 RepID=UPI001C2C0C03|nr:DUF4352 domain-containing protein [Clostridium sp. 001]QXE20015.1 hypothetical protein B5S50_14945 [Clostridium sp. 001]
MENNKMTTCKACGEQIAKGVKKCPHCGKDQRNFFMKHKIVSVVIVIIVLGCIGSALGGGNNDKSTATNQSTKSSQTETKKAEPKKDELKDSYAIGETAKYKGVEMTVTKVDKSNGSEYDKPKDGKEFIIARVKIKNNAKEKLSYNPLYFKMQNSKGQIEDETFSTVNEDTALKSGELAPGGEVEGSVIFEEPVEDKGMLLQYQDNIFSDKVKIQFKIS